MKKEIEPNPFLDNLEILYSEMVVVVKDRQRKRQFDRTSCIKVFLVNGVQEVRAGLSLRGKELLLWIIDNAARDNDLIKINRDKLMRDLNIKSLPTVLKAVQELCNKGIIAKSGVRELYYLNPAHLFRGSRVGAFPDNLVEHITARQAAYRKRKAEEKSPEPLPFDKTAES